MDKTVIIVDDSSYLANQLVDFFTKILMRKVLAIGKDGNDAVELYRKHKPDIITLDISMPNKNGEEALEEIIEEFPDANVIMVSAIRGESLLNCMSKGAKGYIEKPLKLQDDDFISDFKKTIEEIYKE